MCAKTGLVWATKILTDPFNDVKLYHKAPYYLFVKHQLIDPHTDEQEDEVEKFREFLDTISPDDFVGGEGGPEAS